MPTSFRQISSPYLNNEGQVLPTDNTGTPGFSDLPPALYGPEHYNLPKKVKINESINQNLLYFIK